MAARAGRPAATGAPGAAVWPNLAAETADGMPRAAAVGRAGGALEGGGGGAEGGRALGAAEAAGAPPAGR